ncbi:MAG: PilZ domain-containing protein [Terriglobales bacterium]|jgi:hypothetical protein
MTTDMRFECLLVSQDPVVVKIMSRLLVDLSFCMNICANARQAKNHLSEDTSDLLIVDCEEKSAELLEHINGSRKWRKPSVLVVSDFANHPAAGTCFTLRKPVTSESGAKTLKQVYSRMLLEYRKHTRYPLTNSLTAIDQYGRALPVTVTNIGDGGVGLSTSESLLRGDLLSFSLLLPDTDVPIQIEARVQWTRQYGTVGCEFSRIPPADLEVLYSWLKCKCRIKKPLVEL